MTLADEIKAKFPALFADKLWCCNRTKASLTTPIYRRARPVLYANAKQIEDKLIRLQCQGVITPKSYADYAAPIVVVNYSTGLNNALPTQEGILAKLAGNTIFMVVDMRTHSYKWS